MKRNILKFKDKILIKTGGNLKKFVRRRSNKNYLTETGKDEHWTTCCESCAQPIRSNALQKLVSYSYL